MTKLFESAPSFLEENSRNEDSDGLLFYLRKIRQLPFLAAAEEEQLIQRWIQHKDSKAAEQLLNSHLRLVVKSAFGFRGYGLPLNDVIAEGNIGLIKALHRFDAEKGVRFSTYAVWWIRSSIQEYVLSMWSIVKIGTTAGKRRLFFNLRKLKNQLAKLDIPQDASTIAEKLNVSLQEVREMETRLGGSDKSLNEPIATDGLSEWQDFLMDEREDQETHFIRLDNEEKQGKILNQALRNLTEREYLIFKHRHLLEKPDTLGTLADKHGISRERVRQIEDLAFKKVAKAVKNLSYRKKMGFS